MCDMSVPDDETGALSAAHPGLPYFGDLRGCLGGEGAYADLTDYLKVMRSILLDDGVLLKSETDVPATVADGCGEGEV